MRIHTDVLTIDNLEDAARVAGVTFLRLNLHKSRSRVLAYDVILSGSGSHLSQGSYHGTTYEKAATWDEWGIFLDELFSKDPEMTIPRVYESKAHFEWATGNRYSGLPLEMQHRRHRWEYAGRSVTGAYHVHECKCGAVRRYMSTGRAFSELVDA